MTVVYGTVCVDVVFRLPALPPLGGYVELAEEARALGGEAANTACALAKWGSEVALYGNPIGTGPEAEFLVRELRRHGVGTDGVLEGDHAAPVCYIMVTPDGERTMFGRGFAEMETRTDPTAIKFSPGGWFTADPNHGKTSRSVLDEAHRAGMRVYALDFVQPSDVLPPDALWQSSTSWVGLPGENEKNRAWLSAWVERHGCTAVLTDGSRGLFYCRPGARLLHLPVFPVADVVDSTGAGDVFRAGMLYGLDRGLPIGECLKFASAAGALKCRAVGAIAGIPERGEVEALIAAHPEIAAAYDQAE